MKRERSLNIHVLGLQSPWPALGASNGVSGTVSEDLFKAWKGLSRLNMDNNPNLRGPLPAATSDMTKLKKIDVHNCGFEGEFPSTNRSTAMTAIIATNNKFTGASFVSPSVTSLMFKNNAFTQFPEAWQVLEGVVDIDVSNNAIRGWSEAGVPKRWYLGPGQVSTCGTGPPPPRFQWPKIESVFLSNNPIGVEVRQLLHTVGYLDTLQRVRANGCGLHGDIPQEVNSFIPGIENFGGYQCEGQTPATKGFPALTSLDLSNNVITAVTAPPPQNLRDFNLENNSIESPLHSAWWTSTIGSTPSINLKNNPKLQQPVAVRDHCESDCEAGTDCRIANPILWQPVQNQDYECTSLCESNHKITPFTFAPESLCRCKPGYGGAGIDCAPCQIGTYSRSIGGSMIAECVTCPNFSNTTSPKGANVAACLCQKGYFVEFEGTTEQQCRHCPDNTWSDYRGARSVGQCKMCPNGKFSNDQTTDGCKDCSVNEVSQGEGKGCVCKKGFFVQGRSCAQCPGGMTTDQINSQSIDDCICEEGQYLDGSGSCSPCATGLTCPGGNGPPLQKSGFKATVQSDGTYSVFKCYVDDRHCPPGPTGWCAKGREGISCSSCQSMKSEISDGTCEPCLPGLDVLPFVVAALSALLVLCVVYRVIDTENRATQSHSSLMLAVAAGMLVTILQQMGVLSTIDVPWVEPLRSLLNLSTIFNLTLDMMNVGCVASINSLHMYTIKASMVLVGVALVIPIHAGSVVIKHGGRFREKLPSLICAIGTIFMICLIAIVNAAIAPYECVKHPNGLFTVRRHPEILCYEGDEHSAMLGVSVLFLFLPAAFVSVKTCKKPIKNRFLYKK